MTTHAELIAEARALLAKATPGPWLREDDGGMNPSMSQRIVAAEVREHMERMSELRTTARPRYLALAGTVADAAMIVATPRLLALLCDALSAAEARIAELEAERDERTVRRLTEAAVATQAVRDVPSEARIAELETERKRLRAALRLLLEEHRSDYHHEDMCAACAVFRAALGDAE